MLKLKEIIDFSDGNENRLSANFAKMRLIYNCTFCHYCILYIDINKLYFLANWHIKC